MKSQSAFRKWKSEYQRIQKLEKTQKRLQNAYMHACSLAWSSYETSIRCSSLYLRWMKQFRFYMEIAEIDFPWPEST